jgi:hypothetical protein
MTEIIIVGIAFALCGVAGGYIMWRAVQMNRFLHKRLDNHEKLIIDQQKILNELNAAWSYFANEAGDSDEIKT